MVKKILAIAMVVGILGGMLAGCAPKEDAATTPAATPEATK